MEMNAEKMLQLLDPTETTCVVEKIDPESARISPEASRDPTTDSSPTLLGIGGNDGQPTTSKQNLSPQYLCTSCHAFTSDALETALQHFAKCRQADTVNNSAQSATSDKSITVFCDDDTSSQRLQWSREETLRLIQLVEKYNEQFRSYTTTRKKVWQAIAQELQGEGWCPTWENCDSKWKSLKKTYNSIKEHDAKPANKKRPWEFFKVMDESVATKQDENMVANSGNSTNSSSTNAPRKKMKIAETFEDAEERRHQERMANQRRFLSLLEKLIKKFE